MMAEQCPHCGKQLSKAGACTNWQCCKPPAEEQALPLHDRLLGMRCELQRRGVCGPAATAGEAAERIRELEREIERLNDVVDKLPKTADGVACYNGMMVWMINGDKSITSGPVCWMGDATPPLGADMLAHGGYRNTLGAWCDEWYRPADCYSTREAAEAAKGGG